MAREVNFLAGEPRVRQLALFIAALIVLRAVVGAFVPLAFDEAYYWLWSKNLAAGYLDHPPLIAYAIRFGTALFGDTEFGVRAVPLLAMVGASWAVWRSGTIILGSRTSGALAALLFNLTLMVGVEGLVATPDALSMAAAAFFLFALAKVSETGRGGWWIAAGLAAGLALLCKYTGFFLGAGALFWLALVPTQRRWFASPWPYLGAILALAMFVPVLLWNAEHGWISFARQFGRVGGGDLTLRFLGEFFAGQLGLATPFIFILGVAGLIRIFATREMRRSPLALAGAMIAPALLYFLWPLLPAPVQG
ncbi:MAG: glycosyltransferase family 39 protein, partial [Proteobacteria bacterium]|nr:glycosyltransferase family 39 protein [Pseudomonadota bacterium]